MKNSTYYHQYGRDLQKAGFIPTVVSLIIPILPKLGPLSKLKYKPPTAEAERLFIKSFDSTLVNYEASLTMLRSKLPQLPNKTLDTGEKTVFGNYCIADLSHSELLLKLHKQNFESVNSSVSDTLVKFYSFANPVLNTRKASRKWNEIKTALIGLDNINRK